MYIRSRQMKFSPVNPYSAAAEWAAAVQQAANSGKKLTANPDGGEGSSSPEDASLLASWMDAGCSHALTVVEYQAPASGQEPSFG